MALQPPAPTLGLLALLALLAGVTLLPADLVRAQSSRGVSRAVQSCQKVARLHALLTNRIIASTLDDFSETNQTLSVYLARWGERVVAGAGEGADDTAAKVRSCLEEFAAQASSLSRKLEDGLSDTAMLAISWFDEQIFSLFTSVILPESQDKIVKSVEDHLEPSQKEFSFTAASRLRASEKQFLSPYKKASRCIRELGLPELE